MEREKYVPFLVLENYEDGSTLLLREFLLDDLQIYNYDNVEYPTYYATSYIDNYLNTEYANIFSKETFDLIQKTDIEITSLNGLKTHNRETEIISRKIFLLSATEVRNEFGSLHPREGSELMYFKHGSMVAYHENGISESWFLRTATSSQDDAFISVSYDGTVGMGGIKSVAGLARLGIRPAFRISSSIPVILSSDIVEGQEVYIINLNG